MPRETRYYFGRLNVIPTQEPAEKVRLLTHAISPATQIRVRGQSWGFFDVDTVETQAGTFMRAALVKYRPKTEEEVALPEQQQLGEQIVENRVTAKSRFFLHVSSGLIAFRATSDIPYDTFTSRFARLFEAAFGEFFVDAEIRIIADHYRLLDVLKTLQSVQTVSIYLHPSNPRLGGLWKKQDERMKKLGAATYGEEMTAPENGTLAILEDEETIGKIAMAEDGYGKARVKGQRQGEHVALSTEDEPMVALLRQDASDEEVLDALIVAMRRIEERENE